MKEGIYKLLLTSCLLFLFESAFSQEWIPLNSSTKGSTKGQAVTMDVMEDDESSYQVHVSVNGIYDNVIQNEHGTFHSLSFGSNGYLTKEGEPALPLITQLIAIPSGTSPSVSIRNEVWEEIAIGTVYPAQSPYIGNRHITDFIFSDSTYGHPFMPFVLRQEKEMNWRGIRNFRVQICPFRYYPQENKLQVLKEFALVVDFHAQSISQSTRKELARETTHMGIFDNSVFSNRTLSDSKVNRSASDDYDYLIIVRNPIIYDSQKMKDFRRWKALMGYKSKVKLLRDEDNNFSCIKDTITFEYNNKHIKYVLLVGDIKDITARDSFYYINGYGNEYYKCDYWYGCIEGDDVELEIPIGRFPVSSLEQFSNMVDKTVRYEMWKDLEYNVLMMAHHGYTNGEGKVFEDCCDSIINRHMGSVNFIPIYGSTPTSTNALVTNTINQGVHIVNYRGHGAPDFWGGGWNTLNESYSSSAIDSIQSNTNAVFFSIACNTGNLSDANGCMLRTFTCASNGATAFLGHSTEADDHAATYFDQALFNNLLDSATYSLGNLITKAYIDLLRCGTYYPLIRRDVYSTVCGGDPSLELWTAEPQRFKGIRINYVNDYLNIRTGNVYGCDIFISSMDGELVDSFHVAANEQTFPMPSMQKFYISIKKHNYIPYVVLFDKEKDYIQDQVMDYNVFYFQSPFAMGESVTMEQEDDGPVVVKNGSDLRIKLGNGGVLLNNNTEIEKGATLVIK